MPPPPEDGTDSATTAPDDVPARCRSTSPPFRVALLSIGAVSLIALGVLFGIGQRMVRVNTPLIDAAMEIKYEASRFHLWFEELVQGDPSLSADTVWAHLNAAEWYARAMLEGGDSPEGRFAPLADQGLRDAAARTIAALRALSDAAQDRINQQSVAGSARDQDFDALYETVLRESDGLESSLQRAIETQLREYTLAAFLIGVLVFILAVLAAAALGRAERHRQALIDDLAQGREGLSLAVDRLTRSNADLERFAHMAAHDLKEPIRTIGSFAKLLRSRHGSALDSEGREFLTYIIDSANHVQGLITESLAMATVSSDDFERRPIDLDEVLDAVHTTLEGAIAEAHASIHAEHLPVVLGERHRLAALFQNLLANAIKYGRPGISPDIFISAARTPDRAFWRIEVTDNGRGIPEGKAEEAFRIFRRLHDDGGTGLGLAICHRIVECHGGTIRLQGRADKRPGLTVSLTLPAAPPDDKTAEKEKGGE